MKKIILIAMMSLTLASCEQNDGSHTENRIDIQTGIEAITRAPQLDDTGKGSFTPGDIFLLTVVDNGKQVQKDYTIGETSLYWQDLSVKGEKVTFAGCYPKPAENESSTCTFNAGSASNADLLLAPAIEVPTNAKTATMQFRHAMHKLVVRYISDGSDSYTQEELNSIATTLYAHTTCTVDLAKGMLVDNSANTPANYATHNGTAVSWLVVPQSTGEVKLTITLNDQTKEFTLPAQTNEGQSLNTLEGGKMLTITLRVTKDNISFDNIEIGAWEGQGTVEGDIIM